MGWSYIIECQVETTGEVDMGAALGYIGRVVVVLFRHCGWSGAER